MLDLWRRPPTGTYPSRGVVPQRHCPIPGRWGTAQPTTWAAGRDAAAQVPARAGVGGGVDTHSIGLGGTTALPATTVT